MRYCYDIGISDDYTSPDCMDHFNVLTTKVDYFMFVAMEGGEPPVKSGSGHDKNVLDK